MHFLTAEQARNRKKLQPAEDILSNIEGIMVNAIERGDVQITVETTSLFGILDIEKDNKVFSISIYDFLKDRGLK